MDDVVQQYTCPRCGTAGDNPLEQHSDVTACGDCLDELYPPCVDCGERAPIDDTENGVCAPCIADNYCHCANCGDLTHNNDARDEGNETYCDRCHDDLFYFCDECDENHRNGTACPNEYAPTQSDTYATNPHRRMVGVEIECHTEATLNDTEQYKIHDDASIDAPGGTTATELVTLPANGDALLARIDHACQDLAAAGAAVNKSCGLHVHIDAAGLSRQQLVVIYNSWRAIEPIMLAMQPTSRRANQYCKCCTAVMQREDRYRTLNLASLDKHGTIEFRLHSSTTSPRKIKSWVMFLLGFVDTFSKIDTQLAEDFCALDTHRKKLCTLLHATKTPLYVAKYMVKRLHIHNGKCKNASNWLPLNKPTKQICWPSMQPMNKPTQPKGDQTCVVLQVS